MCHKLAIQDESALNWNYNNLADSGKLDRNLLKTTVRDVKPRKNVSQES